MSRKILLSCSASAVHAIRQFCLSVCVSVRYTNRLIKRVNHPNKISRTTLFS